MSLMSASRAGLLALLSSVVACGDDPLSNPITKSERDAAADAADVSSSEKASSSTQAAADPGAEATRPKADEGPSKFYTEPVAEGYQRFEPPAIEVEPGASYDWAQWVGGPLDQDYDVVDIKGTQSVGGHHALVYATTVAQRPGMTRLWQEEDQLTSRLMGGVGGEGGANVRLPEGVVFRVNKGSYILIQTHYLNVTDKTIQGRTVMDIKMEPVDKSRIVASMLSVTSLGVHLPAHAESSLEVSCKVEKDLKFLLQSNHMHDWGRTQTTTFTDPSGKVHGMVDDQSWSGEMALNPTWTKYTLDKPGLVPNGSTITTRCSWNNTTDAEISFPKEMCVFFGFVLNENDIYCNEGKWSEAKSFGVDAASTTPASGAEPAPGEPAGGSANAGMETTRDEDAGVPAQQSDPPAAVGCTSAADQAIMQSAQFDGQSTDCATPCALNPNVAACTAPCLEKDVGLSHSCAACNATNIACGSSKCLRQCLTNSASADCRSCVMANCDAAFHECTGI